MFKNEPKQDSSMWKAQSNLSRIHSQPQILGPRLCCCCWKFKWLIQFTVMAIRFLFLVKVTCWNFIYIMAPSLQPLAVTLVLKSRSIGNWDLQGIDLWGARSMRRENDIPKEEETPCCRLLCQVNAFHEIPCYTKRCFICQMMFRSTIIEWHFKKPSDFLF